MDFDKIAPQLEALIFASDRPLSNKELLEFINLSFGNPDKSITSDILSECLDLLLKKYNDDIYPFEIIESGGGYQFLTKTMYYPTVSLLNGDKFIKKLSNAAMETLAIVAYKQPVTKGEVESVRGVSSDYTIQKLLEKELIAITGRQENQPGQPLVYSTSKTFMDYFGINSPNDLPKLKEVAEEK